MSRKSASAQNENPATPSDLAFPIVGIGASAGGIEALLRFFENMPRDCGMAFVIIVHLSPKHESSVDKILQRATRMPVLQVTETVHIQPNHVYVIPPAMNLEMSDGLLHVTPSERPRERQVVVDVFFRALANAHKTRAFAIILSGTGADGSIGMARIKEEGGITLAQLPDDAGFDGMPRSAIQNNAVDFILPVADMPQKLLSLWQNATRIEIPGTEEMPSTSHAPTTQEKVQAAEAALVEVLRLLSIRTGHDFKYYKRATVLRRIERRMQVTGVSDMPGYLEFLKQNPDETAALLGDMLIGVTNFFRDREAFEALERDIIPLIVQRASHDGLDSIRAWTAACSTGEEAYSLAMMLSTEVIEQNAASKIQIFATDVDERAITIARRAVYPESIAIDVPPAYLRQFFSKEANVFHIDKKIRDRVLFAAHNVLRDPPFSRLQLITCRNFLIYLDRHAQREVLQIFHSALGAGGYLFLGASETADATEHLFATVDKKNRIYRALPVARTIRPPIFSKADTAVASGVKPLAQSPFRSDKRISYATLHQRALVQYGPPTILIDHSFQIVHMSEHATRFLRHVGGEPSHDLLALVHPQLRLDLRSMVLKSIKTNSGAETRVMPLHFDDCDINVRIAAWPFTDKEWDKRLILLVFEDFKSPPTAGSGAPSTESRDEATRMLQGEIQTLRRQLQETIEDSDASTEELKASNEEFQAINEELRSATEELETSKEELQSINEELVTVNYELKTKVEETIKINDDLQNLISSSDIATIFVDSAMRIKWFTPRTATLFNLIADDNGRPLTDITHRLDYPDMMGDATEAFDSLRLIEREVCSADGRWYLARILPYRTAENRIEGAVLNFVDITDRRRAEENLREGLERMRLVAESTTDFAIITMDKLGRITGWNRAAEIMFGHKASEAEGQPIDLIFTPEDRAEGVPARELLTAQEHGHAEDDRWHMRKDGSRFFCSGVVQPLVDSELRGYAKIARDLTDKRMQEYEQQSNLERTQASNMMKDEFIAIMSHELRHPLNLIQLNMDLLARMPGVLASETAVKAVDAVRRSVRNQSQIIGDLLDLSRVQTGKLRLSRKHMALDTAVAAILDAVGPEARARQITLRVNSLKHDDENALKIDGDAVRIEQIVWNLLNNALKFTFTGGTVTVTLVRENGQARLDIQDTGIGISADSLDKVFVMFGQVDRQHTAHNQHGLGIGLALVAQLVQAHGGRVAAASEGEGHGATFTVWLPLLENSPVAADTVAPPVGLLADTRILLVDDSEEILEMLAALCEMEGAQVTTAKNGLLALQQLAAEDFDILVSDIGMSDMDGYELLTRVRKSARNADIPAVALSGYGDNEKAREAGFESQLCKPVAMEDLFAKLRAIRKHDDGGVPPLPAAADSSALDDEAQQ